MRISLVGYGVEEEEEEEVGGCLGCDSEGCKVTMSVRVPISYPHSTNASARFHLVLHVFLLASKFMDGAFGKAVVFA
jgi:hypothetical protein